MIGSSTRTTDSDINSNTIFDKVSVKLAPKTIQILTNRIAHGGRSTISYYGHLDILDDQTVFDCEGIRWTKMFELGVSTKQMLFNMMLFRKQIKEMGQEIMFEVFCNKYQKAYVGGKLSVKEIESITVEQVAKSFSYIKIQYRDNRTGEVVATTRDIVYKKVTEYIPILPDNANEWTFCLSYVYYTALTVDVKEEIQLQGYETLSRFCFP